MNDNEKKELIEVVEQLELKSKNKNRPSPLAITIYMDMLRKNIGSGKCYSILEALKMYTYEVAWTTFDENERGTLEEGKIADLVIMNKDPLALEPSQLLSLEVEALYLSGQKYQSGMGIPGMLWNSLRGSKVAI